MINKAMSRQVQAFRRQVSSGLPRGVSLDDINTFQHIEMAIGQINGHEVTARSASVLNPFKGGLHDTHPQKN